MTTLLELADRLERSVPPFKDTARPSFLRSKRTYGTSENAETGGARLLRCGCADLSAEAEAVVAGLMTPQRERKSKAETLKEYLTR
jgi:hypothetical protein